MYRYISFAERKLEWDRRVRIARQLLMAVAFLHTHTDDRVAIHGCISSRAVWLDDALNATLADYSLSDGRRRVLCRRQWRAPELIAINDSLRCEDDVEEWSRAGDAFACGVVLHELVCQTVADDESFQAVKYNHLKNKINNVNNNHNNNNDDDDDNNNNNNNNDEYDDDKV